MTTMKKMFLLVVLLSLSYGTTNAQQLIYKTEKNWKMHFGVVGGVGISNSLENSVSNQTLFTPEGYDSYSVMYAPRPEVNLGLFSEIEKGKFSFQTTLTYTMRSTPAPVFTLGGSDPGNTYQSLYLNGVTAGGVLFFKPVDKFKFGIGFDCSHFFIPKELKESTYGNYAEGYKSSRSLKTVVGYSVSPRMDINVYVAAVNTLTEKLQVDNITAGATITYKLCGTEVKIKKEVYKLDYSK